MYLGIDIGTSKTAAVITDGGQRLLASHSGPSSAKAKSSAGRSEQSSLILLDSAMSAVRRLPSSLRKKVKAVGVTGQMHGVVVLDGNGDPVSNLINWQDQRCLEDKDFLPWLNDRTGFRLSTGFGSATLSWMVKNRKLPRGSASACSILDLLVMRLCGLQRPVTDPSGAASWGLFDIRKTKWNMEAVRSAGIPAELMPKILDFKSVAGTMSDKSSKMLGLPAGIPVLVPIGDNQASLLVTLDDPERQVALTLGTGGQVSVILPSSYKPGRMAGISSFEYRPFPGNRYAAVASSLCGGSAWNILAETVHSILKDFRCKDVGKEDIFLKLNSLGAKTGNCGLAVKPNFLGERHDPSLTGWITGIGPENLRLGGLSAAFADGITTNLRDMLPSNFYKGRQTIVGSGNALRKNPLLRKSTEKIFGMRLLLPDYKEEAACGAAMHASSVR